MSGFSNRPKILKGAVVEHGIAIPPLIVPLWFDPESTAVGHRIRIPEDRQALPQVRFWKILRPDQLSGNMKNE